MKLRMHRAAAALFAPLLFLLLAAAVPAGAADKAESANTGAAKASAGETPKIEIHVEGAANEAQAKEILRKDVALRRCVIKPVMTDQEIADCKAAYRR